MRIIISPAKKMKADEEWLPYNQLPVFLEKADILREWISSLSYEEQKSLWACNDSIAKSNSERFKEMDLRHGLSPAIISYDGIQYSYMAPRVFEKRELEYVEKHLRILSGFYGVLRPMDGIAPYRLEMQARAAVNNYKSLYEFWGEDIYREVMDDSRTLINLASGEYSRCIERYLRPGDRYISIAFAELVNGRPVQKGVYAKMARGEMLRFLAERGVEEPEEIKSFNLSFYSFDESFSTDTKYVFIRDAGA